VIKIGKTISNNGEYTKIFVSCNRFIFKLLMMNCAKKREATKDNNSKTHEND